MYICRNINTNVSYIIVVFYLKNINNDFNTNDKFNNNNNNFNNNNDDNNKNTNKKKINITIMILTVINNYAYFINDNAYISYIEC